MKTPQVPAIAGMTPLGITPANDHRPGSAWACGSTDSYYWRQPAPHYYQAGTGMRIDRAGMTTEEIAAYFDGFDHNENFGDKKDYT